jgi:uncharacterized membrane protein
MAKKHIHANQPTQQVFAAQQTVTHYQGDIPHPDILRGFDEISSGTAKSLIDLAIEQSKRRMDMEEKSLAANIATQENQYQIQVIQTQAIYKSDVLGKRFGFLVCIACIASSVYLSINGHDWIAGLLAAIPTASLIKVFMLDKK